jgi:quinol monooxygenase YgiN
MFLTMVRIYPRADEISKVRDFLGGIVGPTRVQPGCLGCTLAIESEPEALFYMETWESKRDLLRRLESAEFSKILETMELSAVKPEVCIYEVVGKHGLELIEDVRTTSHQGRGVKL